MRRFRRWLARALIAGASLVVLVGLAPRSSAAACALIPQAAGLERSLERRTIGACTASPITAVNGDTIQPTTTGLLVVRRSDGRAVFTDGLRSWIDGPSGIQWRLNSDHFDWETATRDANRLESRRTADTRPTLNQCTEPGVRPAAMFREQCSDLFGEVIDATERRASGPVLTAGTHHVLSDWRGVPVAYTDDGVNVFGYDGTALLYLDRDLVFTYPGRFVGWIVDGVLRGLDGDAVLVIDGSEAAPTHPPMSPEPRRLAHRAPPKRGQREIPSLQPPFTSTWTRLDRIGIAS